MKTTFVLRRGPVAVALVASLGFAGSAASQPSSFAGFWNSGGTIMRITVNGSEATGVFVDVSPGARALGFKAGEVVLVATVVANDMHGMQTFRYSGRCYPAGRRVPMIGHLSAPGETFATALYSFALDPYCTDKGQGAVTETIWQRVSGR
jgi:hypothetical protein